jgi:hypothetical protein
MKAESLLAQVPVRYVVVDRLSFLDVGRRYAAPVVERGRDRWSLLYAANDSGPRIYRRAEKDVAPSIGSK